MRAERIERAKQMRAEKEKRLRIVPFDETRVWHQFIHIMEDGDVAKILFDPATVSPTERAKVFQAFKDEDAGSVLRELDDDRPADLLSGEWSVFHQQSEAGSSQVLKLSGQTVVYSGLFF